jgi:hypothetical protein
MAAEQEANTTGLPITKIATSGTGSRPPAERRHFVAAQRDDSDYSIDESLHQKAKPGEQCRSPSDSSSEVPTTVTRLQHRETAGGASSLISLRADQWCAANGVCNTELGAGGSVISVPPAPSEVALKFAAVYCPSKVSVSTAAPLLTVSVPLALAPEVS